jgi:hypothetical protein
MVKYNPFKPGSIIHAGMFVGRLPELETLEKAMLQTRMGNPSHFLIHGERGIGKSSLLLLISGTAVDNEPSVMLHERFRFLTVNIELEPADEYPDLLGKIARELQRTLNSNEDVKRRLSKVWEFLTNWEILGVKYTRTTAPVEAMLEELTDKFIRVAGGLGDEWSGIYLFIDEADKPQSGAGLGEFVKVFSERLTKRGVNNVGLGVIGISDVIAKMRASHESSVRIFTPVHLRPLAVGDRRRVVTRGIEEANKRNAVQTTVADEALDLIAEYSEGYPYFIQQYAYSAFDHDQDNVIDRGDVVAALTKENGALELLGQRYFENMYSDEIRSDDYRKVLQVIAARMPNSSTRQQIIKESGLKTHTVNNALTALKKRGTVVPESGVDGVFRLPSQSFAAWIQAFKISPKI